MKRTCLIIGDAVHSSGFAKMNHAYADALHNSEDWDVVILGVNYFGDPHPYPYEIYPTKSLYGGDGLGFSRISELISKYRPDVVMVTNDPWNIPSYLKRCGNVPMIASLAVDGKNCRGTWLNGIRHAIFWTRFGQIEAQAGGYTGPSSVIPLGVDTSIYKPMDRILARRQMGLSKLKDAFIVGIVGRNQPRKRLDLTLMYFAEWVKTRNVSDAYLFCHVAPTGDTGYDLEQLAYYLGVSNRLIIVTPEMGMGVKEENLSVAYNTMDTFFGTPQGEGWGLCYMEAMACGVPVIAPDWAALGEWPEDTILKVPCTTLACTQTNINVVGGIADRESSVEALDMLYRHKEFRLRLAEEGRRLVFRPTFRWDRIGQQFVEALNQALAPTLVAPTNSAPQSELAEV